MARQLLLPKRSLISMRRALLLILDGVGCGDAPDAEAYGDAGANTLRHVLVACPDLHLPNLWSMGLGRVLGTDDSTPTGSFGRMNPRSAGKDSTTGHWELCGVILDEPFAVFEKFPPELIVTLEAACGTKFLGNYAASGTQIIEELGEQHLESGLPILYTSADSVLQIAAHEDAVSLEQLYAICRAAREVADDYRIGRVIARPFVGAPGAFQRTEHRHDFSFVPPPTVLDALTEAKCPVYGVGKVADLFAGNGFTEFYATHSNADGMARIKDLWHDLPHGLLFANLVDFDTKFGHRRDVPGFAKALQEFDLWLGQFLPQIGSNDLLIITADHGNDPTFRGSDHTRESVPVLVRCEACANQSFGVRDTFADVSATLVRWFGLDEWPHGTPLF